MKSKQVKDGSSLKFRKSLEIFMKMTFKQLRKCLIKNKLKMELIILLLLSVILIL